MRGWPGAIWCNKVQRSCFYLPALRLPWAVLPGAGCGVSQDEEDNEYRCCRSSGVTTTGVTVFAGLDTPALILDRERLQRNASRMRLHLAEHSVSLRPHLKTSKSIDVATAALAGMPVRATVATLNEAEYFFSHGVKDLLYAVCITPNKLPRALALVTAGCDLSLIVDSLQAARAIEREFNKGSVKPGVMIEIDCGEHRTGIRPDCDELIEIGRFLSASPRIDFRGVMTHAGQAYGARDVAEICAIAELERQAVVTAAERLRFIGIPVKQVSIGSTPTVCFASSFQGVTEARPGVYLFGDLFQAQLSTCAIDDIAISVLATVISVDTVRRTVIVDAGGLALSKDRSTGQASRDFYFGLVCDRSGQPFTEEVCVRNVHQEHGEIPWPASLALPDIGTQLRILPNHSCMTAAMYDRYFVVDGAEPVIQAVWYKTQGWS
jgi:D-serine deaminase-like pyridoxal phosphate-dependent protein